jgi:hypothetical protein
MKYQKKFTLPVLVILAVLVVGGSYYWSHTISTQNAYVEVVHQDSSNDPRVLWTTENSSNFSADLTRGTERLNTDKPNEVVSYTSSKYDIVFSIPFNKKWGSTDFRILPYEESFIQGQNYLFVGPLHCDLGCAGWQRSAIEMLPYQTPSEVISSLNKNPDNRNIQTLSIGNKTVIVYDVAEMGGYTHRILIGKKFNYSIPSIEGWEEVVKSAQFISAK